MMDLAMDPIASWQDLLLGDESQKTVLLGALTIIVVAISMEALGYSLSRMLSAILGRLRILTLRFLPKAGQEEGNPIVSQIFVYPVKSLKAVFLEQTDICDKGLVGDRQFMLVVPRPPPNFGSFGPNEATHQFMTQRQIPSLATIRATISTKDGSLTLSSHLVKESTVTIQPREHRTRSGQATWRARIWDDVTEVVDLGNLAAAFLSQVVAKDKDSPPLAKKIRLVSMEKDDRVTDDRYTPRSALSWTGAARKVSLTDGFPILIASEASLDALNQRLRKKGKEDISMSRFRPNIVVKGTKPFEEDTWRVISIAGVIFHIVKGCPRCKQSCTDQDTGHVSEEPLETLTEFRALGPVKENVYFAQNAIAHGSGGKIHVGAAVRVLARGDPIWDAK